MYYTDRNISFIIVSTDINNKVALKVRCVDPNEITKNLMYTFRLVRGEQFENSPQTFDDNEQEICINLNGNYVVNCELIVIYYHCSSLDMIQMENHVSLRSLLSLTDYREITEAIIKRRIIDNHLFKAYTKWNASKKL